MNGFSGVPGRGGQPGFEGPAGDVGYPGADGLPGIDVSKQIFRQIKLLKNTVKTKFYLLPICRDNKVFRAQTDFQAFQVCILLHFNLLVIEFLGENGLPGFRGKL